MDIEELKAAVTGEVDVLREELVELSLRIHENPEIAFEEVKASAWLAEYLEGHQFQVERGICQLPTAFRATYGSGKPVIALLAEYDALPDVGHGCGHNIIGTAAAGAGCAAKRAVDALGVSAILPSLLSPWIPPLLLSSLLLSPLLSPLVVRTMIGAPGGLARHMRAMPLWSARICDKRRNDHLVMAAARIPRAALIASGTSIPRSG